MIPLCVAFLAMVSCQHTPDESSSSVDRHDAIVPSELLDAWADYIGAQSSVSGKLRCRFATGATIVRDYQIDLMRLGNNYRAEVRQSTGTSDDPLVQVLLLNEHYAVRLTSFVLPPQWQVHWPGGSYVASRHLPRPPHLDAKELVENHLSLPFTLYLPFVSLLDLTDPRKFTVTTANSGTEEVSLTFRSVAPLPDGSVVHHAVMTAGRSSTWLPTKVVLVVGNKSDPPDRGRTITIVNKYKMAGTRLFHEACRITVAGLGRNGGAYSNVSNIEGEIAEDLDMDRADFTLSAFGLPEPHGVTWPKPTPYWLYGTILAVVMIFLAILLIRWALKPKAA